MGNKLSQDHQGNCLARAQLLLRDQKPGESVSESNIKFTKKAKLILIPKGFEIIELNFFLYDNINLPLIIGIDHLQTFERYGIKTYFNNNGMIEFDYTEYD